MKQINAKVAKAEKGVRRTICLDIFFRAVKFYVVTTVVCNQQGTKATKH